MKRLPLKRFACKSTLTSLAVFKQLDKKIVLLTSARYPTVFDYFQCHQPHLY